MIGAVFLAAVLASSQSVITNPSWSTPPSPEYLEDPMPPFATLIGVNARVVVSCRTLPRPAAPQGCHIVSTTVTGLGFEAKALEIAATGIVSPRRVDGTPQASEIQFRIPFTVEDWQPSKTPYTGQVPSAEALALAERVVDRFGPPFGEFGGYPDYAELEPVRRARVAAWVRELFPTDLVTERRQAALIVARLYTAGEMKDALQANVPPQRIPTEAEVAKAMIDLDDDWDQTAADTLRARYCADYDCGD